MDMLTKLKMLSAQLEDPEFLEQFSRGFDKFLSERNAAKTMQSDFSEININFLKDNYKTVKLNFLKDNYEVESSDINFNSKPLTASDFTMLNVAMAA
ncbi:hypothetical protein P7H38_07650 [Lactococcus raffinolactis]|uniref:hypothetical protein n=1 Tax=Pseudolactococcus raffinolactis TaxID=1366 RepID=UPI00288E3B6D|nr:hypothetical protein [Lactococcus raffinolactis]MDT2766558.1 hypothetical protein [Lactococcus raffinolactis]MDT2789718.1 hypothetical protein [Lactococcus raffinolactis]